MTRTTTYFHASPQDTFQVKVHAKNPEAAEAVISIGQSTSNHLIMSISQFVQLRDRIQEALDTSTGDIDEVARGWRGPPCSNKLARVDVKDHHATFLCLVCNNTDSTPVTQDTDPTHVLDDFLPF